jgi:hypothetical protein
MSCRPAGSFVVEEVDWLVHNDSRYQGLLERILGVIIDSAPAYINADMAATASAFGQGEAKRKLMKAAFVLVRPFSGIFRPMVFW